MRDDRISDAGDSHDAGDPLDPGRTGVRNAVPDQEHAEQRAEIAAFEAWQRLPRIGVEPVGAAARGLKRANKRILPD